MALPAVPAMETGPLSGKVAPRRISLSVTPVELPLGAAAVVGAGAVVGAVVGNAVERFGTRESAVEILLQLSSGERRAIVQAEGNEAFKPGDAVILVTTGGKTRVMLAPKVNAPR